MTLNVSSFTIKIKIKIKKRLCGYRFMVPGTHLAAKFEKVPSTKIYALFCVLLTDLNSVPVGVPNLTNIMYDVILCHTRFWPLRNDNDAFNLGLARSCVTARRNAR